AAFGSAVSLGCDEHDRRRPRTAAFKIHLAAVADVDKTRENQSEPLMRQSESTRRPGWQGAEKRPGISDPLELTSKPNRAAARVKALRPKSESGCLDRVELCKELRLAQLPLRKAAPDLVVGVKMPRAVLIPGMVG